MVANEGEVDELDRKNLKTKHMKKILFPTDFSQASTSALEFTAALCEHLEATIDLVHIFSVPFADASSTPPQYIDELVSKKREEVEKKLENLAQNYKSLVRRTEAVYGFFTAVEIEDYAQEHRMDMIAMGTRGEHSMLEKYLGSNTSEVILRAARPVIAIPEKAVYRKAGTIAFASDHQPNEQIALNGLKEISRKLGSHIQWVHVNVEGETTQIEKIPRNNNADPEILTYHLVKAPSVMEGLDRYMDDQKIAWLSLFIPKRRLFERLFHSSFTRKMSMHTHIPMIVFADR